MWEHDHANIQWRTLIYLQNASEGIVNYIVDQHNSALINQALFNLYINPL